MKTQTKITPSPFHPSPSTLFFSLLLLTSALCFTACPVEPGEEPGFLVKLRIYGDDGTKYYSLDTGAEVSNPASKDWDIALEAHDGTFFVLTNSGVSAERAGSGGAGAVWFTEKDNFDSAGLADAVKDDLGEYAPYTADQRRYAMVMSNVAEEYLNVMTYLGYPESDTAAHNGLTEETYFKRKEPDQSGMASYVPYGFDKKQFYSMRGMPPNYTPNKRVYIVQHGSGTAYSKLQIPEVYLEYDSEEMANSVFVLKIRHEKL